MSNTSSTNPSFDIMPARTMGDEPVTIRLIGLVPDQVVTICARTHDDRGNEWVSHAIFRADTHGIVDLHAQSPEEGTYHSIDPTGLFWSMHPMHPTSSNTAMTPFAKTTLNPLILTFTAEIDGNIVAEARHERLFLAPAIMRQPVREQGLVGTFFHPIDRNHSGSYPAIMILGGSSGGIRETQAALLAAHGYCTLALAYFGMEHLPEELVDIPLEYFETAIHWLQTSDRAIPNKLAVAGVSKGGELALLLATTFPEITAVISYAPSAIVYQGLSSHEEIAHSSWFYRGQPLPFLSVETASAAIEQLEKDRRAGKPLAFRNLYLASMEDVVSVEQATIAVEKINGPVLLISGQDDQMWPSAIYAEMINRRLTEHNFPHSHQHLSYAGAGHTIGIPCLPTAGNAQSRHTVSGLINAYGGNARGNAFAASHSWHEVLHFLEDA